MDGLKFLFTSNPSTALLQLERGEVDVLGDGIPAADYNRTKNDPNWSKYTLDASEIASYYVFMNVREKPFTDLKVRQAVNYAINTQRIQKLLAGQAKALNQIYPDGMPGHQADAQFYTYDPAKARALGPGSFAIMPPGAPMFGYTKEETVIQLHGVGPWGLTYLNPADDPRKKQ